MYAEFRVAVSEMTNNNLPYSSRRSQTKGKMDANKETQLVSDHYPRPCP